MSALLYCFHDDVGWNIFLHQNYTEFFWMIIYDLLPVHLHVVMSQFKVFVQKKEKNEQYVQSQTDILTRRARVYCFGNVFIRKRAE